MSRSRSWIGVVAVLALSLSPINKTFAQIQCTHTGGCGYQECRRAPCITPAVAFATIALIAIIAIAVQNSGGVGAHSHNCGNGCGGCNSCCN